MEKVVIKRYDNFGRGIAYIDNKIIFIPDALIDEEVLVEVTYESKKFLEGKVVEYIKTNPSRIKENCPYYYECGGCNLQNMDYNMQKDYKINKLKSIIEHEKIIFPNIEFIENDTPNNYRNKIELKMIDSKLGFYKTKTHEIVEINYCLMSSNAINKVIPYLKKCGIKNGNITIRANYNDEILLIIETEDKFDYEEIKKNNKLVGIVLNNKLIYNDDFFIEIVNNLYFKVSYNSFFQINRTICSKLFKLINEYTKDSNVVADLYCGVGTLSLVAAKNAKKVFGIEIVENAIINAVQNAKINKIDNVYFNVGSVDKVIDKLNDNIDTFIVDPPRKGLDNYSLNVILSNEPKKIIYVSCDPVTLARDLKELTKDYKIKNLYALDMFSNTYHCESVVILERK